MTQAKFKFISDALGDDQFTVVSFSGQERISDLYHYEIEVKAPLSADIDLDSVLDSTARFIIEQNDLEFPVNGILSSFEEYKSLQNFAYFKAVLVPRLWKLSTYRTNEIYYFPGEEGDDESGQTIADIITQVLEKAGLVSTDFDLEGLTGDLLKREYVCQFNESDFDFIARLMENEGVFYYFEQSDTEEKIIFINDQNYLSIPRPKLKFDVASMARTQDDCVHGWSCRKQRLPEQVVVRDYNLEEPSLDVSDTTSIDTMGHGTEYIYGKHVQTDSEATYLSQLRAEEYLCRKTQYFGESSVSRLQAGYLFVLDQHPNTKYNSLEYLPIEVNHEGQSLDMTSTSDGKKEARPQYHNSFVAIAADIQYRPPLKTAKPRITGTLHARIDGELDSKYAQLDSEGRYKVSLPFDFHNENHPEGLASARVRMMQPYAGENRGMQFPMARGTEVLLTFVDGDPDRPLIAGAVSSPTQMGPVNADNQTESVIQTGGNNKIRMGDEEGKERVVLSTPQSNSWIRMGAHNDPIILNGRATVNLTVGDNYTELGAKTVQDDVPVDLPAVESVPPFNKEVEGTYRFTYTSALSTSGGADTAIRTVIVHPAGNDVRHELADMDGIRIRSGSSLWLESGSQYGNYKSGVPGTHDVSKYPYEENTDKSPAQIGNMLDNFGKSYNPSNLLNYKTGNPVGSGANAGKISSAMLDQDVTVSSLDTFTTQEGNIYDFGGYWNYNLGNSYAEDHLNQSAALNATHDYDLLDGGGPGFSGWRSIGSGTSLIKRAEEIAAHDQSNDWTNIWVEKKFGDSYEYTEGSSISVTKGGSQDVEIGGVHVEEAYRSDGTRKSWSIRGGGPAKEKKWTGNGTLVYESETTVEDEFINDLEKKYDRNTGDLYSHTHTQGTGMGLSAFEFDYSNKVGLTFNFGSLLASETFGGAKITNDNYLGLKIANENTLGASMKFEFAPLILKVDNDGAETNIPGLALKLGITDIDTKATEVKARTAKIDNLLSTIGNGTVYIKNGVITVQN